MVVQSARTFVLVVAVAIALRYLMKTDDEDAAFITDFTTIAKPQGQDVPSVESMYDVIVVGGGNAGCVLASRLSEDPSVSVLLLEAGPSPKKVANVYIPAAMHLLWRTQYDWSFPLETQSYAGDQPAAMIRAKILGGCTSINALFFHHGSPSNFDFWAKLQKGQEGAEGWLYKNLLPYFHKFERYVPRSGFNDVDASLRNERGLVEVGHHNHASQSAVDFVHASDNIGLSKSYDLNTEKGTIGAAVVMTYIDSKGKRVTSESAYLTPEVLKRPNLKVALGAQVHRVLFTKHDNNIRASGVEFADKHGMIYRAEAREEVVLSAGVIKTPQILMLSGVGPAAHLKSHGIPVVRDLPGVGENLQDHLQLILSYMDKAQDTYNFLRLKDVRARIRTVLALLQYKLTGRGALTSTFIDGAAFLYSTDPAFFPPDQFDTSRQDESVTELGGPDLEIMHSPFTFGNLARTRPMPNPDGYSFSLIPVVVQPKSRGTVKLRSSDPNDPPIIDPNYLAHPDDVQRYIRGVRLADRIVHTEPLRSRLDPAGDARDDMHHNIGKLSDEELKVFVRNRVDTVFHPVGTARMAPVEDGGVVDPYLRVHGIPNLRVVDASMFPQIISGHPAAAVYAVAEKAADMIKDTLRPSNRTTV